MDIDDIFNQAKQRAENKRNKKEENKGKDNDVSEENKKADTDKQKERYFVDIISFSESGNFLTGITLFPWQRIILKAFYMGSEGNESLSFTAEEWQLMEEDLDEENLNSIKHRFDGGRPYIRQLILCLGRRSFKSFITSIIACYEAYKMLCFPSPQEVYGISALKPIWILNVASNQPQAKIVFEEIEAKVKSCDFLERRIGRHTTDEIQFLTDSDIDSNSRLSGNARKTDGSVVIVSGHSNSSGLRGHAAIVIIYDEIAHFVDSSGNSSDKAIYNALQPSLATFVRKDINNKRVRDGKSILISSPSTKNRLFYHRYINALSSGSKVSADSLAFKLPTWKANPLIEKEDLLEEYESDPEMFMQEYAAEFSYGGVEAFFDPSDIDECVKRGLKSNLTNKDSGEHNIVYYAHVDTARTGDNYAIAVVHVEDVILSNNESEKRIVLDHVKIWVPIQENNASAERAAINLKEEDQYNIVQVVKGSINPKIVDDYIIDLSQKFNLKSITYDHWESSQSIKKLEEKGLPTQTISFAGQSKTNYYGLLYKLVAGDLLDIFPSPIVSDELKFLQKKRTSKGWTVEPLDSDSNDDIADCIAGAAFVAYNDEQASQKLPKIKVVRTGFF